MNVRAEQESYAERRSDPAHGRLLAMNVRVISETLQITLCLKVSNVCYNFGTLQFVLLSASNSFVTFPTLQIMLHTMSNSFTILEHSK